MFSFNRLIAASLALLAVTFNAGAQDRDAVVQRARTELATLLKQDPAKLPVDKPVTELGVDELTAVEWVMALERAYKIDMTDDKAIDEKTRKVRKDLTINSMAAAVLHTIANPRKRK